MYRIETGPAPDTKRLVSDATLDADDFRRIASALAVPPVRARKTGFIAARKATSPEHVETRWNGKESEADAAPGDWIVTALGPDGSTLRDGEGHANTYVVKASRFEALYEPAGAAPSPEGTRFRPRGVVEAIRLAGGFEIVAPWGELQRASDGWLLLNGGEVYGNHRDTFAATYEIIV